MPHTTRWEGPQPGLRRAGPRCSVWSPLRSARVRLAQLLLLLPLVMLAACEPLPPAPLKVGMNAWVGYDPLALAREEGLLDARQVKVIELSSSSETLRNFRNGLLDAAALTLDETLRLADDGVDVHIVAVLGVSAGADVVLAGASVAGPRDLRGKTLAVEGTTVGALMLQRLLQAGGLRQDEVTVRNLEASQHLAELKSGRVDAAVSYEGPCAMRGSDRSSTAGRCPATSWMCWWFGRRRRHRGRSRWPSWCPAGSGGCRRCRSGPKPVRACWRPGRT